MSQILKKSKRPVCLSLGNPQIEGDFGGIYMGRRFETLGVKLIEGGLYPENHLERVAKESPDLVILTDAFTSTNSVDYLITEDLSSDISTSTHSLPLSSLASYLKTRTGTKVIFFGINRKAAKREIDSIITQIRDEVFKPE